MKQQFPGENHNKPENTNATKIHKKQDKDKNKKWAYWRHRSVQFPHHTQTSSNSPTIEADSSNGYVHISLFDRTYCIFHRN